MYHNLGVVRRCSIPSTIFFIPSTPIPISILFFTMYTTYSYYIYFTCYFHRGVFLTRQITLYSYSVFSITMHFHALLRESQGG